MKGVWFGALALLLASCAPAQPNRVDAADYDAFWLWAGVTPQPALERAKTIYLLAGEVRRDRAAFASLRAAVPHLTGPELWLVVRLDTLDWRPGTTERVLREAARWRAAGNRLVGVQIDFDARTAHLDRYTQFLRRFRNALPRPNKLSVAGLLDWSANGDPAALNALRPVIDEIVIQTYQGRQTIPGYEGYFRRIARLTVPFKVGLVQNGEWHPPSELHTAANFRGYVVFLIER